MYMENFSRRTEQCSPTTFVMIAGSNIRCEPINGFFTIRMLKIYKSTHNDGVQDIGKSTCFIYAHT